MNVLETLKSERRNYYTNNVEVFLKGSSIPYKVEHLCVFSDGEFVEFDSNLKVRTLDIDFKLTNEYWLSKYGKIWNEFDFIENDFIVHTDEGIFLTTRVPINQYDGWKM